MSIFDVVHPAFPLPTTASPTLQGSPKEGFGEAVVACDVPLTGRKNPTERQKLFIFPRSLNQVISNCRSSNSAYFS